MYCSFLLVYPLLLCLSAFFFLHRPKDSFKLPSPSHFDEYSLSTYFILKIGNHKEKWNKIQFRKLGCLNTKIEPAMNMYNILQLLKNMILWNPKWDLLPLFRSTKKKKNQRNLNKNVDFSFVNFYSIFVLCETILLFTYFSHHFIIPIKMFHEFNGALLSFLSVSMIQKKINEEGIYAWVRSWLLQFLL